MEGALISTRSNITCGGELDTPVVRALSNFDDRGSLHTRGDCRQECYLLRLPPELLLHIVRFVLSKDLISGHDNYPSLIPLSLLHRALRQVCISAGLFRHLTPTPSRSPKWFKAFSDSLDLSRITSLGVDLGNERVWPLCAHVMGTQPSLDELCVMGTTSTRTSKFCDSELGKRFAEFKGTSIVFRRALFMRWSLGVLARLGGKTTVTSIVFDRTRLHFHRQQDDPVTTLRYPLFPLVKRIKYIGGPRGDLRLVVSLENFVSLFMVKCQVTHFEASWGDLPVCCGLQKEYAKEGHYHDRVWEMMQINRRLHRSMTTIYQALQQHSSNSLKVFIDRNARADTFMDWSSFYSGCPISRFRELKLVVLQVRDINQLVVDNRGAGCPVPLRKLSWENAFHASHHHSIWRHLSLQYGFFCDCDCVLVEIDRECRQMVDRSLWTFATQHFLHEARHYAKRVGNLRYFIVGNSMGGYSGIQKFMEHWKTPEGRIRWAFRELEKETCKRVLLEQGYELL